MTITINWSRRMVGGAWQCNATGNDGETHLLDFPASESEPRAAVVRELVRSIEDQHVERRRLEADERAKLATLRVRVQNARRGTLTNAETRALLADLLGELRDELRG